MERHDAKTILISRTDSIGDVMLTLPMAGVLKKMIPGCRIVFLGRNYTRAIIEACIHVDEFVNWDLVKELDKEGQVNQVRALKADVALHVFPEPNIARLIKKADVPMRIGTSHRLFHLRTCNKLVHFTRRKSDLHEAQLNMKLLAPLGIPADYTIPELASYTGFEKIALLKSEYARLIQPDKFNLILHPRSKGSAREWGLDNYSKLIELLPADKFNIFISGTKEEGDSMSGFIAGNPKAMSLCGLLSLEQFISFIAASQGLVAASTGPLHIASALGKKAVGIYSPMKPIHPGRWAPIGPQSQFLVKNVSCTDCRKSGNCHCIREVSPEAVAELLCDGEYGKDRKISG
jgi:ADP-heptose:LPS heptosyltransferase